MAQICILTDSTAYFPLPGYPGNELVSIIPLHVSLGDTFLSDNLNPNEFAPKFLSPNHNGSKYMAPSVEDFCQLFYKIGQKHVDILALLHAGSLSCTFENASQAASIVKNSGSITVIDTNTLGAGLGLLVQAAAQAALTHQETSLVSQSVRGIIPHIYTALFLPNLSYLANSGFLDPAQAIVGDMLGIIPFYIFDSGNLVSVQKARNPRQLIDLTFEFISEFTDFSHIALLQGLQPYEQEMRSLKERISNMLPEIPLTEHNLSLSMMSLLGPNIFGVVVMEKPENGSLD